MLTYHLFWFKVESYNPVRNHWTSLPCLNKPKGALAATTLSNKLFAIGGGNGLLCFSEVEMFDVNVGCWIFSRSMLQKVNFPSHCVLKSV